MCINYIELKRTFLLLLHKLKCYLLFFQFRWLMMGIIGFSVGILGFLLHQIIDIISEFKWELTSHYIHEGDFPTAILFTIGYSLVFLITACLLVIYQPAAAGSGIPEIIGFLNGTRIKDIFKLQTLIVKFLSCAFAVGCGMPVGYEGPMIHLGSLVAAGVSQFKSATFECSLPFFSRFRNSEDRRNFISAGAAAGVASAFGAPVGGLLFAMEEVSSFWKNKLSWQVFFCCMVATFTTDLLNSSFHGFKYKGDFGLFKPKFISKDLMAVNVIAVVPAVLLGILGGILGSSFTHTNIAIARWRKRFMATVKSQHTKNLIRILETVSILLLVSTVHIFVPALSGCTPINCTYTVGDPDSHDKNVCYQTDNSSTTIEVNLKFYTCHSEDHIVTGDDGSFQVLRNGSYSESATLLYGTGEQAVYHLYSKNTHKQFSYTSMATMLVIYFFLSCYTAGTYLSCGLGGFLWHHITHCPGTLSSFSPCICSGADACDWWPLRTNHRPGSGGLLWHPRRQILGRVPSVVTAKYSLMDILTLIIDPQAWMDPGAFALLGSVSFFAGICDVSIL